METRVAAGNEGQLTFEEAYIGVWRGTYVPGTQGGFRTPNEVSINDKKKLL